MITVVTLGRAFPLQVLVEIPAGLLQAVDRLEVFPESGRIVPEVEDPAVREVLYGAYRIVYELRAGRVEINTVFRASRLFAWRPRAEG